MSEIGKNYLTEETKTEPVTMTVYSALNKRKIYLDRLSKLKENGTVFVGYASAAAKDIDGMTIEAFENKCKSVYDKSVAVIRNFYALNAAITKSNALTTLTIAGKEYTVAEAIVRYDRLNNEIEFLNAIAKNVAQSQAMVNRINTDKLSERAVTDYVAKAMESVNISAESAANDPVAKDFMDKFRAEYIERNTYALIDPYKHAETIQDKIDALQEFISEFNEAINICNMQTTITVDLISD